MARPLTTSRLIHSSTSILAALCFIFGGCGGSSPSTPATSTTPPPTSASSAPTPAPTPSPTPTPTPSPTPTPTPSPQPSTAGIAGAFFEDLRLVGATCLHCGNGSQSIVGKITVNVSGGSAGDSQIILSSVAPSAVYEARFCSMSQISDPGHCTALGSVNTDANGAANFNFKFPTTGAFSGVFFLSRNGQDEVESGFRNDDPDSFFQSKLQPMPALNFGQTPEFGSPGTDPLTDGSVVHHDIDKFHFELHGAVPSSTYKVQFCSFGFGREGCLAVGDVTTDASGTGSAELMFTNITAVFNGAFLLSRNGGSEYLTGFFVSK